MTQPQDIQAQFLDGRAASALLEEAPGFIAIFHGPEHRWVFANRAFERLFPGRVVIGGTARDSFPETEWQGFLALMDRVYTTGERFVGEQVRIAFIDTDTDEGATRELFLDFVYEPIRDADGAVTGIFLDGFDVTARVRAEAQLREHETRLRAIYDGTYEYIGLLAPDGTLLEANRASLEFAGNTREEVVGRPFWETPWFAFTPGAPETMHRAVARAAAGEFVRYEALLRSPTGQSRTFDISLHPIRDEAGAIIYIVPEGRDITERERAERAGRESEERYRTLFNAIDEGFCIIEVIFDKDDAPIDYRFLETNATFERQTGLVDTIGRLVRTLLPNHEQHWFDRYGRVALTGQPARFEEPAAALGRWYDVYATRVGGADSRKIAVLFSDITARKEAEAERELLLVSERAAREAAEEAVQARDTFLSIAAHELRTPLTGLKGTAQLLQRRQARGQLDPERLLAGLGELNRAVDRLTALTDDLLDVARLRTGQMPLAPRPTDLVALAGEVLYRAHDRADDGHQLLLDAAPAFPSVPVDAARIDQVLTNLVDNAVKYSPNGGAIVVSLRAADAGIAISVRDSGIGLPPGAEEAIFAPFGRAENAAASNLPGMGLGLFICRNIVERHGGWMRAESAGEGLGTTVTFWLPLGGPPDPRQGQ
jgi:PAS domain S-box-containing protein